jgi:PAS domain S-box-containing protein
MKNLRYLIALQFLSAIFAAGLILFGTPGLLQAAEKELTVASFPLKPLIFRDSDGEIKGINADLLNRIAQEQEWSVNYLAGSWGEGIERAQKGEVDLLTSVMYTEERDSFLDYTKQSYFTVWSAVYAVPDSGIDSILKLQGQTVAIMTGDQNGLNFKNLAKKFGLECHYIEYPDFAEVFQAVRQGKTAAGVAVNIYGAIHAPEYRLVQTSIIFDPKPLYFAVPEGKNHDVLEAIDAILERWKKNEKSFYYQTLDTWLTLGRVPQPLIPGWFIYTFGACLLALSGSYVWTLSLKKQVSRRTEELSEKTSRLEESEAKLKLLFSKATGAIFVFDRKTGNYIDANQAAEKLTGRPVAELKTLSTKDVTPIGSEKRIRSINKHDSSVDFGEVTYLRPNGETRTALLSAIPIDDHLSYGLAQDITDRKLAEIELSNSYKLFHTVLNSLPAGVYVSELDSWDILFMNDHLIQEFGADYTGRKCWEAFRHKTAPCEFCSNKHLLDKNGQPTGVYIWDEFNPVTGKHYLNHDRAIEWVDGRIVRLHISTDISEMKTLENQLRQKFKMEGIGVMAGGIAHNFNNNLAVILGSLELAQRKLSDPKKLENFIEQAKMATLRSRDLVAQILQFSRQRPIKKTSFKLSLVIEETEKLLAATLPATIRLLHELPPEAEQLVIEGDPGQIQEALINLCNNAVYAMDEKGDINIRLALAELDKTQIPADFNCLPGRYGCLSVTDTGRGVPENLIGKIFDPFFTTKKIHQGTGMGLATVRGIIDQHDGLIKVTSSPGEGSTFELYFPLSQTPVPHQAEPDREQLQHGSEAILLVDDESDLLEVTRQLLEELGYRILPSGCPKKALEMLASKKHPIDLVLTDQTMPNLTGVELAQEVKKIAPEIPVILMTGYSTKISEAEIGSYGISAYCRKPLSIGEISSAIRKVLNGQSS